MSKVLSLEGALASGDVAAQLLSLQGILRGAYATGRSSRASLRAVMTLLTSDAPPVALKLVGFEILWTLAAATDAGGYRALLALSKQSMFSADHPDLTVAALSTLSAMPAPLALEALLVDDAERSMADAISGEAPVHVRAASVAAFARLAAGAWAQAGGDASEGARGVAGAARVRTLIFDRALEVFRAVVAATESASGVVATAAWVALRAVFEGVPRGAGARGAVAPLPEGVAPDSALGADLRGGGAGWGEDAGACAARRARALAPTQVRAIFFRNATD
jgi:hypothetical protein